jgi:hypothetical protein
MNHRVNESSFSRVRCALASYLIRLFMATTDRRDAGQRGTFPGFNHVLAAMAIAVGRAGPIALRVFQVLLAAGFSSPRPGAKALNVALGNAPRRTRRASKDVVMFRWCRKE